MVTPQGFNALLKIVEEPPEHVMFIFATTEPDKVIGTIRSRTHHYPFRLVPQEVMGPYLEQICADEHIEAEAGVLRLAMRAGGGSVRDTLSVLDQLMVGAVDGKIPYDSAVALLGFTPDALIGEAIDAVADKNGEALYGVIQKVVVGGFDPRRFVEDLLARVRDLLVLTLGGERAESVLSDDTATENMDDLHRQAASLGLAALTQMADTINATLANMTGAISPRMRLELLAARLLAGRETGVVAQAAAPSSGMPEAGHAGGAAASESQRPSGSRRYAAQSARGRHAVERPRLPRIRPMPSFPERPPYWRKSSRRWVDLCRKAASRPLQPSPSRLKRSLRHPNYPMPKLPLPPSPWLSPRPSLRQRTIALPIRSGTRSLPACLRMSVATWTARKCPACCWTGPKADCGLNLTSR